MGKPERRRIAGLVGLEQNIDWGYFGSMKGAGRFWAAIDRNDENLSLALDAIPQNGLVGQGDYASFVDQFMKAFKDNAERVAVATRLLCMKRSDTFVCLDSKNRSALCKEFGIIQSNMSFDRYWCEIIERVRDSVWWNASRPTLGNEDEIWLGRTAFLDSLYYKP
jgi:hypothetical protein